VDDELEQLRNVYRGGLIECTECARAVDELVAIKERWHYWSGGRDLRPFCPDCAEREVGHRSSSERTS
jgi:hypothetical protein